MCDYINQMQSYKNLEFGCFISIVAFLSSLIVNVYAHLEEHNFSVKKHNANNAYEFSI